MGRAVIGLCAGFGALSAARCPRSRAARASRWRRSFSVSQARRLSNA